MKETLKWIAARLTNINIEDMMEVEIRISDKLVEKGFLKKVEGEFETNYETTD